MSKERGEKLAEGAAEALMYAVDAVQDMFVGECLKGEIASL
jgi:hypothetical protein